ncbi:TNT domain-containing protein [uncultured Thiodictyon sp.]|uniref:TNT domain-containing protein n=1 Tax=uncultured Thiodictyon sp. TaxID=1846217 RepID=UPI003443363F
MRSHRPPKAPKLPPKRTPNLRSDLNERWFNANGDLDWPPNTGFSGEPKPTTLPVGTKIDRYGSSGGSFLSPEGTPYAERALPYEQSKMRYHAYEVLKPLDVKSGSVAPHFDQPGNGIQYETSRSVQQLIDEGYLKEVPK